MTPGGHVRRDMTIAAGLLALVSVGAVVVGAVAFGGGGEAPSGTTAVAAAEDGDLGHYADVRASLGLPAEPDTIQSLIDAYGLDPEWGIPFSPEEKAEIDRRIAVQNLFSNADTLAIRSLPGFAGFYFDHTAGGAPTLLTTDPEVAEAALVGAIGAELAAMVRINPAVFTYEDLADAVDEVGRLWNLGVVDEGFDYGSVTVVRLDTLGNRVVVGVDPAVFNGSIRAIIQQRFDVPIAVEPVAPSEGE